MTLARIHSLAVLNFREQLKFHLLPMKGKEVWTVVFHCVQTQLRSTMSENSIEVAKLLLDARADVNAQHHGSGVWRLGELTLGNVEGCQVGL